MKLYVFQWNFSLLNRVIARIIFLWYWSQISTKITTIDRFL